MYTMTCTRPNIGYVTGKTSRYVSNPCYTHRHGVKRILKYLKKTQNYGIKYGGYPLVLEGYSDASWIIDKEDYSSSSGWIFMLRCSAISRVSKKQTYITNSTIATKFVTLSIGK